MDPRMLSCDGIGFLPYRFDHTEPPLGMRGSRAEALSSGQVDQQGTIEGLVDFISVCLELFASAP
jgi:hypothetical protein